MHAILNSVVSKHQNACTMENTSTQIYTNKNMKLTIGVLETVYLRYSVHCDAVKKTLQSAQFYFCNNLPSA